MSGEYTSMISHGLPAMWIRSIRVFFSNFKIISIISCRTCLFMEKTVASKGNQEYTYESFPAYLIPEYCILIVIVVGGVSR
jgi:hypothetical protein